MPNKSTGGVVASNAKPLKSDALIVRNVKKRSTLGLRWKRSIRKAKHLKVLRKKKSAAGVVVFVASGVRYVGAGQKTYDIEAVSSVKMGCAALFVVCVKLGLITLTKKETSLFPKLKGIYAQRKRDKPISFLTRQS